jgi:hypothetical protein
MNSTESRVPRMTGLPASTFGSSVIREGAPLTGQKLLCLK